MGIIQCRNLLCDIIVVVVVVVRCITTTTRTVTIQFHFVSCALWCDLCFYRVKWLWSMFDAPENYQFGGNPAAVDRRARKCGGVSTCPTLQHSRNKIQNFPTAGIHTSLHHRSSSFDTISTYTACCKWTWRTTGTLWNFQVAAIYGGQKMSEYGEQTPLHQCVFHPKICELNTIRKSKTSNLTFHFICYVYCFPVSVLCVHVLHPSIYIYI